MDPIIEIGLVCENRLTKKILIENLRARNYKSIVILTGAGISVSAGIPVDFLPRLKQYQLPDLETLFSLSYFQEKPQAFIDFYRQMNGTDCRPTPTHYFIRLLDIMGMLSMCFTQNIDSLEDKARIDKNKVCQAHGTLQGAVCSN